MTLTISRKLSLLLVVAALSTLAIAAFQLMTLKDAMLSERQKLLVAEVETAVSIATAMSALAKSGDITENEAKLRASQALAAISYGANDYVFVNDSMGKMIVHPNKKLVGQTLWTKADSNGVLLFQELIARAKEGGGFTAYLWPRAGSEADVPKLSYSAYFAEWDWVVGTGVYVDDLQAMFMAATYKAAGKAALLLAVLVACALPLARSISRPLTALSGSMEALASGRHDIAVPHIDSTNEMGKMARAVEGFRRAAIEASRLEAEASQLRGQSESDQARQLDIEHEKAEALQSFVDQIAHGFECLSQGDLTVRLDQPVSEDFEKIRALFNDSVSKLEEAMGSVVGSIGAIRTGLTEISVASNDLAQRTEQQAASLEETVAALSEVTGAVNETANGAGRAQVSAATAQKNAEKGGEIVARAVAAMAEIEQSSDKIGKIIGVIDEIAFQTNLLALNAGVEAARAGEAGRGFAVVAQEVRGLAQRSAEAAKEIKTLISTSRVQVEQGVQLVTASGRSLEEIVSQVGEMSQVVAEIARSAREQAVSLKEVSAAADQMDKVTQQNAAMVEETTAAAQTLSSETEELAASIMRFRTSVPVTSKTQRSEARRVPTRASAATTSPQRPVPQMRTTGTGGAVPKAQADTDSWEEF